MLGILPSTPVAPIPGDMQPTLKLAAQPNSVVEVKFVRGDATAVSLEMKIDNAATWSDAGTFYKSPAELKIPDNPDHLPRSVQLRARYVEGNTPVGLYSQVDSVSTVPAA